MPAETVTVTFGPQRGETDNPRSERREFWSGLWRDMENSAKPRMRVLSPEMYSGGAMFVRPPRDHGAQEESWRKQWEGISDMPPELREEWEKMRKEGKTRQFWRDQIREWENNGANEDDIPPWLPPMVRERFRNMEKRRGVKERWADVEKRSDEFWRRFHQEWKDGEDGRERFFGKLWRERQAEERRVGDQQSPEPEQRRRRFCPFGNGNWKRGPGCWRERKDGDDVWQKRPEKRVYDEFDVFDY